MRLTKMPKKISEFDKGFAWGVAVSCSAIQSTHDQPRMISEALGAAGLTTRRKMKRYGVEDYDLDILQPVFKELEP
jgi:hypothetical protein